MSATKITKTLTVAIDDGYAQTKLYGEDENGNIIKRCERTSVRSGGDGLGDISGNGSVGMYETEDEGIFTISEEIESENTQFDGFHTSAMNRAVVNHALIAAGYGGKNVRLITGLPVSDYYANGSRNKEKIDLKTQNLLKPIISLSENHPANIVNVSVGCQAVAAWIDYVFDDSINPREGIDTEGLIAIVDIGGRTTDIATIVDNGQSSAKVDYSRSTTANIGVLDVYGSVRDGVQKRFNTNNDFAIKVLDKAVRTKQFKIWGKNHDISDIVEETIKTYQGKLVREIQRNLGDGAAFNSVVFVGGGGVLFKNIADSFQNGHMMEDPEFANARGLFKYQKYMQATAE